MLGNFLIGLREGLEAALVVSILVAFLVRTDRRAAVSKMWIGVGMAVAVSVGVALAPALAQQGLTFQAKEIFGGTLSILAYGIHDLQEAAVLPGLSTLAFDVSDVVPPDSWYGVVLKGLLNFSPQTTVMQAAVWLVYVVVVLGLFLRSARPAPAPVATT